jgi:2-phospho-L-lactate transferase/gluconeogenesis factor (CofD/UPF0052 family)
MLKVVLFSGGRGSGALSRQLVSISGVHLTLAINGYDDGASTGEVRRFLGDCLGPSDFRKNASRLAAGLGTCEPLLIERLDARLPAPATEEDAEARVAPLEAASRDAAERLTRFLQEIRVSGRSFRFADCSVGNLVFAGGYLLRGRRFNEAVADYCALLGLPCGLIENVTDGTNAWLVGVDERLRVLPTEEAIVTGGHAGRLRDIFLIDPPPTEGDLFAWSQDGAGALAALERRSRTIALNSRLAAALAHADCIIYAPGTQHSSLYPSYLTSGLGATIASNLRAIKLLLTNIQPDAEIADSTAVDLIERAVYYLKEKGARSEPTPALITHYLVNDPARHEPERAYVPLGPIDSVEDPRLVRIGNYEDGVSGRHDASRVLTPFLEAMARHREPLRAAVLLHDSGSSNKIAQTLIEMVRGGVDRLPLLLAVFYAGSSVLDASFVQSLPFAVTLLEHGEPEFHDVLRQQLFDYAILFESSGMYRGEDLVALAGHLASGRLDGVWGSRRLSVRDIDASYRLRYRGSPVIGAISYLGSHVLSLTYLLLYGRYVADTLTGVRAVRAADAAALEVDLTHKDANHHLLTALLGRKADILEIPVQFLSLSPERVKRTSPMDGLWALGTIIKRRLTRPVNG